MSVLINIRQDDPGETYYWVMLQELVGCVSFTAIQTKKENVCASQGKAPYVNAYTITGL